MEKFNVPSICLHEWRRALIGNNKEDRLRLLP
jgi:hypothetical protein